MKKLYNIILVVAAFLGVGKCAKADTVDPTNENENAIKSGWNKSDMSNIAATQKYIDMESEYGCYSGVAEKVVRLPGNTSYIYDKDGIQINMALKKNDEGVWVLYSGSLGNTPMDLWQEGLNIAVAKIKDITKGEPIRTGFSDTWKGKNADGAWLPAFKAELEKQGLEVTEKGPIWIIK